MCGTKCLMAGLVLSVVAGSNAAHATPLNPSCTNRDAAVTYLSKTYQEQPVAIGLASNGGVFEVLTNNRGNQLVNHRHNARRDILHGCAGEHWEPVQLTKVGTPS